jgi:hypothetical protein
MTPTRILLLAFCLAGLALAPTAHAGWFAAEPLDGPADIESVAIDLGREDTGGVAYVKRDAGGARAWFSVFADGAWSPPAAASGAGATETAVAAGERGRVAVAWIENGTVFGALVGAQPVQLSAPGGASGLAMDLGVNGVAYVVWAQNGDVRAAQLADATWQAVPAPLDIDPARPAGAGASRPRVAVAADGSAVIVWGETMPEGRTHVFMRRIYGTTLSAIPQLATTDVVDGQPAGSGDSADVGVEFDRSFAWVVYRQDVGGRTRSVARRLRASTFEPPVTIDGGQTSAAPDLALSGGGTGHAVAGAADGTVVGAALRDDAFGSAARVDTTGAAAHPVVAFSDREDTAVVWRANEVVRGRFAPAESGFGGEIVLSRPDLGPVAPGVLAASSNRVADVVVAMLQGAPGARHLAIAMHDLPPSRPVLVGTRSSGPARPVIRWNPGLDLIGAQRFRVLVDGRQVGTTARTSFRVPRKLKRGTYRIQVIGVDRRGQASPPSRSRTMRVDAGAPILRARVSRRGRCVTVVARARDRGRGSGLRGVRVSWGDRSARKRGLVTRHCYRRGGRYTVTVTARDRAGNTTTRKQTVRV